MASQTSPMNKETHVSPQGRSSPYRWSCFDQNKEGNFNNVRRKLNIKHSLMLLMQTGIKKMMELSQDEIMALIGCTPMNGVKYISQGIVTQRT